MAIARGITESGNTDSKEFLVVLKRMLAIMLTGMLLTMAVGFGPVNAQSVQDAVQDNARAAKVRGDVLKLGVGEKAGVEVKLRDNRKLKGYIAEASEDSFTVVNSKNESNQRLAYADVEKVKKREAVFDAFMDNPRRGCCRCGGYVDHSQARPLRWRGADSGTLLSVGSNAIEMGVSSLADAIFLSAELSRFLVLLIVTANASARKSMTRNQAP